MDVGTVLAAVGSSTLIATSASAVVSWKIATRQQEVDRERLAHERERYEHEKQSRRRDDARLLCQQVIDELAFMAASMQVLPENYRFWKERRDDPETSEQVKQIYDDLTKVNADMPRLLSDLLAAPGDVLPEEAWEELRAAFLEAQQTYGRVVLAALGPEEYTHDRHQHWLWMYGRANMIARRLMTEID